MKFEKRDVRRRAPGIIHADEVYTLREFLRRIDCGDTAWRMIRRKIKLRRIGQKVYVLGRDWLDYLASVDAEPIDHPPRRSRRNAMSANGHGSMEAAGTAGV